MDTIRYHLFENPFYLILVLGVVELVLLGLWKQRRTSRLAWSLLAPVVAAGLLMGLAALVKTDREQINELSAAIAADINAGRLDAAAAALDEAYDGWGGNKKLLLVMGRGMLGRLDITSVQIVWTTLTIESGRARMRAQTIVSYTVEGFGEGRSALRWDLSWIKRPQGWRIINVQEPVQGLEPFGPA